MYVTNKKEWSGVDIVKIFIKACYEAVLCLVATSQIDESGPNKPNIVCHVFNDEFSVARYRRLPQKRKAFTSTRNQINVRVGYI